MRGRFTYQSPNPKASPGRPTRLPERPIDRSSWSFTTHQPHVVLAAGRAPHALSLSLSLSPLWSPVPRGPWPWLIPTQRMAWSSPTRHLRALFFRPCARGSMPPCVYALSLQIRMWTPRAAWLSGPRRQLGGNAWKVFLAWSLCREMLPAARPSRSPHHCH
jgi:hypothetical protein